MWASKYVVEKVLAHRIRKGDSRLDFWTLKYVAEAMAQTGLYVPEDLMDSKEAREVILFEAEVRKQMDSFTPVWPPDVIELVVSKTPVDLNISGIFRSGKNQTLHVLDITPYPTRFDMKNDPTTVLKAAALRDFVQKHHSGRPQLVIHQFGRNQSDVLTYKTFSNLAVTQAHLERVVNVVKALEADIHFPSVPCPDARCPFREVCFPSEET